MLISKKFAVAVALGLSLGAASCRKFFDVNTNPNVAQTATLQTLLPAAQLYLGTAVGADLQIPAGIWAQYWTQAPIANPAYAALDQYAPGPDAFGTSWKNLYASAENFYQVYNYADSQNKTQYRAISLLMRAYTFQILTDGWGDVPFTEALMGQPNNGYVVNPKYDSQIVVYRGILAYIDSANALIDPLDGVRPGSDDLIYGGDMTKWKKFSNTLKLKVLMRLADKNPLWVKAKLDTLYSTSPQFIGMGDDAKIGYGSAGRNPLYTELSSKNMGGTQQLAASKTALDSLRSNNDPRSWLFYKGTVGVKQGAYNVSQPLGAYGIPSAYVGGDVMSAASANAPVNLLTSAESYFLQSEAVARGWVSAGATDEALFQNGIRSSFSYYASQLGQVYPSGTAYSDYISFGGYWTVFPNGGTLEEKIRFIITQKWFAMCGNQSFEAWTEWRRTGYPDFFVQPLNSVLGTEFPQRLLYPVSESTSNGSFPAGGVVPVTTKVWWDVN